MALLFVFGITLLIIYRWCHCRNKHKNKTTNNKTANNNNDNVDETQPFLDIRSENTIKKQQHDGIATSIGNTLYFQRTKRSHNSNTNNDIYHDIINDVNENEDGDELIAHYGSTAITNDNYKQKHGYVIAKCPK
eukprot:UN09098